MDNYSKNKINIPGFIVLIIWTITVIAVANHNSPFVSTTKQDQHQSPQPIDILNSTAPINKIEAQTENPRFRFENEVKVLSVHEKDLSPLTPHEDKFIKFKDNEVIVLNSELSPTNSISLDGKILGVITDYQSLIYIFTSNSFVYAIKYTDSGHELQQITKLPYKLKTLYNIEKNNFILTDQLELKHLNIKTQKEFWSFKLDSVPTHLHLKDNKLLVFSGDSKFTTLDITNGKSLSTSSYPYKAKDVLNLDSEHIIVQNSDSSLVKFNLATQETVWETTLSNITSLEKSNEYKSLFIIDDFSKLIAINTDNGSQEWNRNLEHKNFNFIFPIKVTGKEIQSFELGWRHKGEIFITGCSNTGLCFIDPKNGRVLKVIRSFSETKIAEFLHAPYWNENQIKIIALKNPEE